MILDKFLIIIFILLAFTQKNDYYNKDKHPSTIGIQKFIKTNHDNLITEYEYKIDTLYDVYIWTGDLSETSDNNLGEFYPPDQIVITDREKYIAFEFSDLTKYKKKTTLYTDRTVKAVVFHELTHAYFYQTIALMKNNEEYVSSEYAYLRLFPNLSLKFGTTFIEEGVCEYVVYYLNESASLGNVNIPKNEKELLSEDNYINVVYQYSVYFLQDFLNEYGVKEGIKILVKNTPPTYEEILNPQLYFNRLNHGETK